MTWLAEIVSRMLDPDERDAVRGDLEESGAKGGAALRDLLGLVARRLAALWTDWRPWLALTTLAIPIGILLSREIRHLASGSAIYSWMYVNNWTPTYVENSGFRADLLRDASTFLLAYAAVIFWSWTVGFVIGSLSRRAVWINAATFCVLILGGFFSMPQPRGVNAAAFAGEFYRSVLPSILRITLVLVPAFLGMSKGAKRTALSPMQIVLWATLFAGSTYGWYSSRHWGMGTLLPLVLTWPVAYMIAATRWRHRA